MLGEKKTNWWACFLSHSGPAKPSLVLVTVCSFTAVTIVLLLDHSCTHRFMSCDDSSASDEGWVVISHLMKFKQNIKLHCFWSSAKSQGAKFESIVMQVWVFLEDLADSITDSNHMRELMDCLVMVFKDVPRIFPTFSGTLLVIGEHLSTDTWPALKRTWYSITYVQPKECSPKSWRNNSVFSLQILPSFMQNLMLAHCSNLSAIITVTEQF